jgi:hypothetical protein
MMVSWDNDTGLSEFDDHLLGTHALLVLIHAGLDTLKTLPDHHRLWSTLQLSGLQGFWDISGPQLVLR